MWQSHASTWFGAICETALSTNLKPQKQIEEQWQLGLCAWAWETPGLVYPLHVSRLPGGQCTAQVSLTYFSSPAAAATGPSPGPLWSPCN